MTKIIKDFSISKYSLDYIQKLLNTGDEIILRVDNTKGLTETLISNMMKLSGSNRLKIRVEGGYKGKEVYAEGKNVEKYFTFEADTYELQELKKIILELERIERGINSQWDDLQKVLYFIGELKNNIVFNPYVVINKQNTKSKEDQSLKSLIIGKGVCAAYSLILKELCDRNNIECDLIFGTTREKDSFRGAITHAWNIITINGKKIPIDSTWNAQKYNEGSALDFASSANVNNFIKHHFPGKYEQIQDYKKELVSIDGRVIRMVNNFINKDIKYCTNIFVSTRKDGSKFQIAQLEDVIINNIHLYSYLYRKQFPDGTFGKPILFYSSTNIARVVRKISQGKNVQSNQEMNFLFDNVLFSKQNLQRALHDGTYYLGKIDNDKVLVDLSIGSEINFSQRSFQRKDGSKISIQSWPGFNVNGVNRYKIYEYIFENKKYKVSKNTVFTEMDLMTAKEGDLDLLLSRDRIDRKNIETNGYLGRVVNNHKESNSNLIKFFKTELPNKLKVKDNYFIDYFKEITFDDMKILVKTYEQKNENGNIKYFNRVTGRELKDKDLCLKVSFAYIWLGAAGTKWSAYEEIPGYDYAFSESSEEIFDIVNKLINNDVVRNGNIDPVNIFIEAEKTKYKYALEVVANLFSVDRKIAVINELFKKQNPSSVSKKKQDIKGFDNSTGGIFALENAYELAEKEKKERELKEIIKVFANSEGEIITQKKHN